jgi:hypothetical protein
MHPLAALCEQHIVTGSVNPQFSTTDVDSFGNPIVQSLATIQMTILIKPLTNQPYWRASYGVDATKQIVQCYILKPKNINLSMLGDKLFLSDSAKFLTIVDINQSFLEPVNRHFGQRFTAIRSLNG